ncbi:hypothetical protein J7T55_013190 [Diaporthe amygdali]|uniref:uncharacterized protein n=1 Tax=Phomopsis amygdali TaxID=1214568 RepID=UPI0022FF34E9|nr:uncharacterized protein J7T55_013190 [Diaporthe amygdali]KAJ0118934.1 hypothetical protein J7T55_013190 [Diaporthe amygdali]
MSELKTQSKPPRWVLDLKSPPPYRSKASGIPDPPGFPSQAPTSKKQRDASKDTKIQPRKQATPEEMDTLKLKKAWEVALAPVKNLPMTAIMMYMTGNSLQIFSIMMVFMAFKNPIAGLLGTNQALERFETDTNKTKMLQVKLAYVAMQLVALAVGIWKVNAMGLLPLADVGGTTGTTGVRRSCVVTLCGQSMTAMLRHLFDRTCVAVVPLNSAKPTIDVARTLGSRPFVTESPGEPRGKHTIELCRPSLSRNYTMLVCIVAISLSTGGGFGTQPPHPSLSTHVVGASPFEAIEGFPISAAVIGGEEAIFVNDQAQVVAVDTFASNGVIHQIDQVLNPYTPYFGISNTTNSPTTSETDGTVADILLKDERLTIVRDIFQVLSPDFISRRLALAEAGGISQILAIPSNDAFAGLPNDTIESSIAPSNQPLSLQLYSFGLLDTDVRFADLDFSGGPISVASTFTGINVTASQVTGGATFINNAGIQEQVCGLNGCVWVVDRVLDPLYLAFGPLDRGAASL